MDTNLVENAICPTGVGKKNWLFFGDAEAGERSAALHTIIESCRRRGIEPYACLRDVLTRLPKMTNWQIKDLTPEAWAWSMPDELRRLARILHHHRRRMAAWQSGVSAFATKLTPPFFQCFNATPPLYPWHPLSRDIQINFF
ncbi:MAG TPA: transposase domain-containing protein [Chthoniobacterales bacterium]